jgi:hypothetical protein
VLHIRLFLLVYFLSYCHFWCIEGGERPNVNFWIFAILGALIVFIYMFIQSGEGDLAWRFLHVIAILLCGFGYAEGGVLSKK